MSEEELDLLRYPIGKYDPAKYPHDEHLVEQHILAIGQLSGKIREAVKDLTPEQLDTPYRPDGWTLRQVVHHIPDSHMNGYLRQKLALTEEVPTIRTYHEAEWALLPDTMLASPEISINLLEALHQRWVVLLKSLTHDQLERKLIHPDTGECTIRQHIGLYAWHGEHHLAHITNLLERKGWKKAEVTEQIKDL
ncbi:YfiT family bacillithiol transferase [Pontibacter cellulosilyticus]|uniref:Metal-dependent hydrolase n=1 Tax=Pontibacter cellulosilyticus TaxID=1720253 RepID=A0A923N5T7_9BACT|nr:putative metal-dependent hydrolase [Pontibacter cellulosilyticus]MBC5992748.1 putative metal-dependent hydrolase [Pontibacter cellulosilyticus]